MKLVISTLMAAALLPVAAQEKTLNCDHNRSDRDNGRRQQFCEIREFPASAVPRMDVDGRTNGGINVKGWDRNETLVRAQVNVWAPTLDDARGLAKQVTVQSAGGTVRADAPDFGND